jgi:hypothetical protein
MIWQIVFLFLLVVLLMILISSYMAEKKDGRKKDHDSFHKDDSDMF